MLQYYIYISQGFLHSSQAQRKSIPVHIDEIQYLAGSHLTAGLHHVEDVGLDLESLQGIQYSATVDVIQPKGPLKMVPWEIGQ